MPSLVATMSTLAYTTCMRTHYVHTNINNGNKMKVESKKVKFSIYHFLSFKIKMT